MKSLWHHFKIHAPALVAYWVLTFYGLAAFSGVIFLLFPSAELTFIVLQIFGVTLIGQVLGHIIAFLRPRLWVVFVLVGMSCLTQSILSPLIAVTPWIALGIFLMPFAVGSGFLALRNRTEIFGAWMPVMYSVAACITLINVDESKLATWKTGAKSAIWDVGTVGILAGAIVLFLIYLVARQSQSLSLWQEAARIPEEERPASALYKPRARVSWMTWIVVGALAMILTVGTAVAAPYLFRTAPQKGEKQEERQPDGERKQGQRQGKGKPKPKPRPQSPQDLEPPDVDWEKIKEGLEKAVKQGVDLLSLLLIFLVSVLAVYLIFGRPLYRVAYLKHLERPAWPVPGTRRIQDLWTRALIVLRDLQVEARESDTVEDIAERAHWELTERYGSPPTGIQEAAAIYSRVQYSIGVAQEDQTRMAAAVELLSEYAEDKLSWWEQLLNLYRGTRDTQ